MESHDSDRRDPEQSRLYELVEAGSEIAGSVTGASLGFFVAGPVGAVAGAASGSVAAQILRRVGTEIAERIVGPRQRIRMGAALLVAAEEINRRLEAGDELRRDGFFGVEGERADADEVLEGVLLHAANEYEERKVPLIANLFASIAFDEAVSPARATYLLQLADRLTYRQLLVLALFSSQRFDAELVFVDAGRAGGTVNRDADAVADADALGHAGLLGVLQEGGWSANMASVVNGGSFRSISLAKAHPTRMGEELYRLMHLDAVPDEALRDVLDDLQ